MMEPRPLVYVAGPITGDPFGCVRQATAAFRTLRALGCVPFLPQLSVLHEMVEPMPYEEWLAYDFGIIRRCDALVRLPGASEGADREVSLAIDLALPVFHWNDGAAERIGRWLRGECAHLVGNTFSDVPRCNRCSAVLEPMS